MSVAEFILARVAEDEAQAQRSLSGPEDDGRWEVECPYVDGGFEAREEHMAHFSHESECVIDGHGIRIYDEGGHDRDQALHIAAHDPARTLVECAAYRAMAQDWLTGLERQDPLGRPLHLFDPTLSALLKSHERWLRALATIWSEHPDYDERWRP